MISDLTMRLLAKAIKNRDLSALHHTFPKLIEEYDGKYVIVGFHLFLNSIFDLTNGCYLKAQTGDKNWQEIQDCFDWLLKKLGDNHILSPAIYHSYASFLMMNNEMPKAILYYRRAFYFLMLFKNQAKLPIEITFRDIDFLLRQNCIIEDYDKNSPAYKFEKLNLPESLKACSKGSSLFTAYGDAAYFKKYARRFIEGVQSLSPDFHSFLVIGDADSESLADAEALQQEYPHFHYCTESIAKKFKQDNFLPIYCSMRRFMYIDELLDWIPNLHLVTLDIDLFLHKEFMIFVDYARTAPVTFHAPLNMHFDPLNFCSGGFISIQESLIGRKFIQKTKDYLTKKAHEDYLYWIMDQYGLFYGYYSLSPFERAQCKNIFDKNTENFTFSMTHHGYLEAEKTLYQQDYKIKREDKRFGTELFYKYNITFAPETLKLIFTPI